MQVGLRNISVSDKIAESISPAVDRSGSTPFSWYIWYTIVQVQPTGTFRKYTGPSVSKDPIRWWSMISRISASSRPSTAWLFSLWSTRIICFLCTFIMFRRETTPKYLPSRSTTGKYRKRTSAIALVVCSTKLSGVTVVSFSRRM